MNKIIKISLTMLIVFYCQLAASQSNAVFCTKPVGFAISKIQNDNFSATLDLFEGPKYKKYSYLYFSQTESVGIEKSNLKSLIKDQYKLSKDLQTEAESIYHELNEVFPKEKILNEMANKVTNKHLSSDNSKYIYMSSNSEQFYNIADIKNVRKIGATLQLNKEAYGDILNKSSSLFIDNLTQKFSVIKPDVIIFNGITPSTEIARKINDNSLVIYIKEPLQNKIAMDKALRLLTNAKAQAQDFNVVVHEDVLIKDNNFSFKNIDKFYVLTKKGEIKLLKRKKKRKEPCHPSIENHCLELLPDNDKYLSCINDNSEWDFTDISLVTISAIVDGLLCKR